MNRMLFKKKILKPLNVLVAKEQVKAPRHMSQIRAEAERLGLQKPNG